MIKFKKLTLFLLALLMLAIIILPSQVFAADNTFDKLLTDGKLIVHSIKPTDIGTAWTVVYENTIMNVDEKYYLDWDKSFNSDFSKCTIYYGNHQEGDSSKEVEISYVYDKDIKTVVDSLVSKIEGKDTFSLNEIEFINYLLNQSEDSSMINYSSELRKAISYKNFDIDVRLGDDNSFYTERGGNALFSYNGTIYYIKDMTTVQAKHIIYVDDNTNDVLNAVKTRLTKIFGKDFNVTEAGTVESFLETEKQQFIKDYNLDYNSGVHAQYATAEEFAQAMMNLNYYNEDAYYSFVTASNIYEKYYTLNINGKEVKFLVIKDSSKVNDNISLDTNDIGSNITISAKTTAIPLDTLIQVSKITNGIEYDKIVKLLEVTNSEMFDLKLYSNSTGKYIQKLSNGKFEVKIPVNESLKGKNLMVYYVDSNNKIIEYEVTVENGFATFTTDHFSIYTLAEKKVVEETPDNTPSETPDNTPAKEEKDETPKTGTVDVIEYVWVITLISILGIAVLNKKETK